MLCISIEYLQKKLLGAPAKMKNSLLASLDANAEEYSPPTMLLADSTPTV
jgi:hypothetical protein